MRRFGLTRQSTRKTMLMFFGALLLNATACDALEDDSPLVSEETDIETGALRIETYTDPSLSAPPLYIQVKVCTTEGLAREHLGVGCRVDPEFALVGGGAKAEADPAYDHPFLELTPFLTESRPLDGRTWQASSRDHLLASLHTLTVYAIGMRLEGVNTQRLREAIRWKQVEVDSDSGAIQMDDGWKALGGGARTIADAETEDSALFLTGIYPGDDNAWRFAAADHMVASTGKTTGWMLQIEDKIIEGFGALEIQTTAGTVDEQPYGFSTSLATVDEGWALIGMGGEVLSRPEEAGRMLVSVAPGDDFRSVEVTSRNLIDSGAGTTQAFAVMARKVPGSRGLCNPEEGHSLQPDMDGCVQAICSARPACCDTAWDDDCVSMVETKCGRSCDQDTCQESVFEPEKWVYPDDGAVLPANCYLYALNRYPNGAGVDPGYSLGLLVTDSRNRYYDLILGDGLIPTTFSKDCRDGRTKIYIESNPMNYYHVFRQDSNGVWSEKFDEPGEARVATPDGYRPFTDEVNSSGAFYCACHQSLPDLTAAQNQPIDVTAETFSPSPGLTIQLKTCSTTALSDKQSVDCRVDDDFALVGGGIISFSDASTALGAFVTESRPLDDDQTWRGATADVFWHHISVRAIGMKLDGVAPDLLKEAITLKSAEIVTDSTGNSARIEADPDAVVLSGGGRIVLAPATSHLMSGIYENRKEGDNGWVVSGIDDSGSLHAAVTVYLLQLQKQIFEGFGALEIRQTAGVEDTARCLSSKSRALVSQGWALIGTGAYTKYTKVTPNVNYQKYLAGLYPDDDAAGATLVCENGRHAVDCTNDRGEASTIAYVVEARKLPGSHGLLETGGPLSPDLDACAELVCGIFDFCCTDTWNATCVAVADGWCNNR